MDALTLHVYTSLPEGPYKTAESVLAVSNRALVEYWNIADLVTQSGVRDTTEVGLLGRRKRRLLPKADPTVG